VGLVVRRECRESTLRMEPMRDSGDMPEKRGRSVGRQAEMTPRVGSTAVQMTSE